jgi:NADH:ubiquinone oxidoreductase subunit 3 (subunit A)
LIAVLYLFFGRKDEFQKDYRRMLFIFFVPMIYFVFAWHCWFYGWSFGCRALLQTMPLLALPLAYGL